MIVNEPTRLTFSVEDLKFVQDLINARQASRSSSNASKLAANNVAGRLASRSVTSAVSTLPRGTSSRKPSTQQ